MYWLTVASVNMVTYSFTILKLVSEFLVCRKCTKYIFIGNDNGFSTHWEPNVTGGKKVNLTRK